MTFQDLYLGQHVRILSWDELNSIGHYDSIGGIHLPDDTFFHDKMRYLCGATLTIVNEPSYSDNDEDYLSNAKNRSPENTGNDDENDCK